jgi:proteasome lid subunit RPN8/RPN11
MAATNLEPGVASSPDSLQVDLKDLPSRPFPGRDPEYRVLIEERAYEAVMAHARSEAEIEVCGVLVGDLARDEEGAFLTISGAIRGRSARERSSQVTFTHSTWEQINREMDEKYPDRRIVGWYHTHPGYGVFLSEVDIFAHSHFFNASWQVALVVDQKAGRDGLFIWSEGAVVRCRRYWVGQDLRWEPRERLAVGAPPQAAGPAKPAPTGGEEAASAFDWTQVLSAASFALCILLFFLYLRAEFQNERLAVELDGARRELRQGGQEFAHALAFRLRDQLDRGRPLRELSSLFEQIIELDPGHKASYEALLPELAPVRKSSTVDAKSDPRKAQPDAQPAAEADSAAVSARKAQ